ncbi:cytochrome P450 [Streptomyces sp. NPDC055058]
MERDQVVFSFDPTGRHLHEDNAHLRSAGPAVRVSLPGGVTAWSVTRLHLLRQLAADDRLSRDARQHWPGLGEVPEDWPLAPFLLSPTVLNAYGSDHRRLRDVMEDAFTEEHMARLRAGLERRVPARLATLGDPGSGTVVDIRSAYAEPIASETLCDLFGVPPEDWPAGRQAMADLLQPSADPDTAAARLGSAMGFLSRLIDAKRDDPGDDMATTLLRSPDMTEEERVLALAVTIAGGVPATTGLITNAVLHLLQDPKQLALVASREASWPAVIEETLRHDAPVQHMPLRYAVDDIDVGDGIVIRRGEPVVLGFGAGGRDRAVHGDTAETFDIRRTNTEHVAFGHGVHHCVGAPLGRLEASVALPALFEHFPGIAPAEPADTLPPLPTFVFSGKAELPVRL